MFKTDRILALDIGASGLKMAEFVSMKSGGIELVNFGVGTFEMDPQSDTDRSAYIVTTIREVMQDRGIKPGRVLMSVSGQAVFSRFVKLPPVDKEKIFQIILYEAQQNVPFPIEEVVWDYQLIGGVAGEIDVMLAAIKAEIIEKLTDSVEATGLVPDLVDVAPMALYNAVRYNYTNLPECTLVIDMGARSTDLIFIEKGRVFSRSIPVAGNAITQQVMQEFNMSFTDAEELKKAHAFVAFGGAYEGPQSEVVDKVSKSVRNIMTRMHAEITRSISFYRSQQAGQQPSLILLTGGTSAIAYTDTFLKEKLKVDVDYLNPFQNVAVSEDIEAEDIAKNAGVLGQVVGLALRRALTCPIEINLIPPKVLADQAFRKKQPMFVLAAVGILLILIVWCGYFIKMSGLAQERLVKVQVKVTELQAVESRLAQAEGQVADVRGKIGKMMNVGIKRTQWLQVLDQINGCLLDGMWLTSIKPVVERKLNPDGSPVAEGSPQAAERTAVKTLEVAGAGYNDKVKDQNISEFRDKLRASSLFGPGTEITWLPSMAEDDVMLQFKIRVELKTPMDL